MNIDYGIAEVSEDGTCIIIEHDTLKDVVNENIVRCQLLYELQSNIYLNRDVIADIKHIRVNQVAKKHAQVLNVAGKHSSLHKDSFTPQPTATYFPALIQIPEKVHFVKYDHILDTESVSKTTDVIPTGLNEPTTTKGAEISKFGPTTEAPLGRIAYTRSGDKGDKANVGSLVHSDERNDWIHGYLKTSVFSDLFGEEKKGY
ncbi:hypothetical protein K501DRAFT_311010 [Backusella circina FSU 941]|nr:hypothetical protein K501DRAFT_311010 [Backusella circina FSU 941]